MGTTMKMCSGCQRHLMAPEPQCPFCGAELPVSSSPLARCGPAIMLGVSIMLGSTACGPLPMLEDTGMADETATTTATGSATANPPPTTTSPSSTTAMMTTGEPPGEVSTAAESSSDGVDDEDDFGCGFYAGCIPDGGDVVYECSLFAQDCPEGEKCMPWANDGGMVWNATRCAWLDDTPVDVGEPCMVEGSEHSGLDDCGIGQMCWGVDPMTNLGTCEDMCTGSFENPICDDPDDECMLFDDGAMALCVPPCDPVMQDCGPTQGCYPVGESFFCVTNWAPESVHGDACDVFAGCAAGQVCIGSSAFPACDGSACCSTACDLNNPDADIDCAALAPGQQCEPWYVEGMAPAGSEHIGVCALPS